MNAAILSPAEYLQQGNMGRHETFAPRYGWLVKGCRAVQEDPHIFKASNAIERLGVGKNMVASIRFWCLCCKLIQPANGGAYQLTELGQKLFTGPKAYDPYLEDEGTLWLLHWQIFLPRLEAVAWPLAFNKCRLASFDIKQLAHFLHQAGQAYERWQEISSHTWERDASCILRMYADDRANGDIDSPFTRLGLLCRVPESNHFTFNIAEKPELPPLIFAAACFSYMHHYAGEGVRTVTLAKLSYDFNSPGVVFKIPESAVGSLLEQAAEALPFFSLEHIAGNLQLHLREKNLTPAQLYWLALEKYYKESK
ncbi:DUF4007 family protein [Desulforamulus putei]|uniref:DUF4007 domain-containing protein n=1 Tax=Desulforamulus putei DSM 12395 TaxID=1121429 RepID=A0A1M4TZ50_9FIRM|nr:DUF4007 family protein [Desulforamulus putei]SHE49643.1 Protein of unknown function [Desulforamulus putei DSM 12395]